MDSNLATPSPLRHQFFRNPVEESEDEGCLLRFNQDGQADQEAPQSSDQGWSEESKHHWGHGGRPAGPHVAEANGVQQEKVKSKPSRGKRRHAGGDDGVPLMGLIHSPVSSLSTYPSELRFEFKPDPEEPPRDTVFRNKYCLAAIMVMLMVATMFLALELNYHAMNAPHFDSDAIAELSPSKRQAFLLALGVPSSGSRMDTPRNPSRPKNSGRRLS